MARLAGIAFAVAIAALLSPARAQDAATVAGTYCLTGVMEVGSCIRLSPAGKFEYFLAYGAYDEKSEGTWKLQGGGVVLDTPAYDKRPTFAFKRVQAGDGNAFEVMVENKRGRTLAGIDVIVTCDGSTKEAGVTQSVDFRIDCTSAPTAVALGLRMYDVGPQVIDIAGAKDAGKAYVFEFDPGDLGRRRFSAHRLRFEADRLFMVYTNSAAPELEGRTFEYVRSR